MAHLTKICGRCGKARPINAFYASGKTEDGRTQWCRACHKIHKRQELEFRRMLNQVVLGPTDMDIADAESLAGYRRITRTEEPREYVPVWVFMTSALLNVCLIVAYLVVAKVLH